MRPSRAWVKSDKLILDNIVFTSISYYNTNSTNAYNTFVIKPCLEHVFEQVGESDDRVAKFTYCRKVRGVAIPKIAVFAPIVVVDSNRRNYQQG